MSIEVAGAEVILWLQSFHPALDVPMEVLGSLVRPEFFFMLVVPVVYWTLSPRFGWWLLAVLTLDLALGEMLRTLVAAPRPFWVDARILGLDPVTSVFSSPAGYASSGVCLFAALALWSGRGPAWVAALAMLALTSLAKLYHGATALDHLLWGYLQGALVVGLWWRALPGRLEPWFDRASAPRRAVAITAAALGLWLLNAAILAWHQGVTLPPEYARYQMDMSARLVGGGAFFASALLLAFGLGFVLSEARGGVSVAGAWWRRLLRVLVGLPPAVVLFGPLRSMAVGRIADDGSLFAAASHGLVNLAFAMAAFGWVSFLAPRVFRLLRLSPRVP